MPCVNNLQRNKCVLQCGAKQWLTQQNTNKFRILIAKFTTRTFWLNRFCLNAFVRHPQDPIPRIYRQSKQWKNIQTACKVYLYLRLLCICFHKILFCYIHCHHNYRLAKVKFSICGGADAYHNHNGDIISGVTAFAYLLFCLSHHLFLFVCVCVLSLMLSLWH